LVTIYVMVLPRGFCIGVSVQTIHKAAHLAVIHAPTVLLYPCQTLRVTKQVRRRVRYQCGFLMNIASAFSQKQTSASVLISMRVMNENRFWQAHAFLLRCLFSDWNVSFSSAWPSPHKEPLKNLLTSFLILSMDYYCNSCCHSQHSSSLICAKASSNGNSTERPATATNTIFVTR
jgi:hypothetical protein